MNDRTPSDLELQGLGSDTEATAFLPEMHDELPDLPEATDVPDVGAGPPPMPLDPLERPHTREHFAMSTIGGHDEVPGRPAIPNDRLREPAPRRKRPTLMPKNMPTNMPRSAARKTNNSVLQPIRARRDNGRPDLARADGDDRRESSDVVQTFDSNELDARPEPLTTANPAMRPRRRELSRNTAAPRRNPQPRRPQRPATAPASVQPSSANLLPLSAEALAMLITDQRRRLHILDGFARGLEIGAGVLGTLSLAVLIAAMVSILVGNDVSVLNASSALVSSGAALGLTLLMVVSSVALRQLAHVSAQIAALLEALAGRR